MTTENSSQENTEKHGSFYEISRKILLATVGATMVAADEVDSFITRLAEKGELAEKDARHLMREFIERRETARKEQAASRAAAAAQPPQASMADVEALKAQVADLTARLEELKKASQK